MSTYQGNAQTDISHIRNKGAVSIEGRYTLIILIYKFKCVREVFRYSRWIELLSSAEKELVSIFLS